MGLYLFSAFDILAKEVGEKEDCRVEADRISPYIRPGLYSCFQ